MRPLVAILLTFLVAFAPVQMTVAAPQEDGCEMVSCASCRCCVKPAAPSNNSTAPAPSQNRSVSVDPILFPASSTIVAWELAETAPSLSTSFSSPPITAVPLFQRDCSYLL